MFFAPERSWLGNCLQTGWRRRWGFLDPVDSRDAKGRPQAAAPEVGESSVVETGDDLGEARGLAIGMGDIDPMR